MKNKIKKSFSIRNVFSFIFISTIFFYFSSLFAVQPIDSLLFSDSTKDSKKDNSMQVRILIQLEPHKQVSIKSVSGKDVNVFRPTDNIVHMLRASVDKPTNFYVDGWHIENVPVSFDSTNMTYSSKLNFFKIYENNDSSIEELIGSTTIRGMLQKQDSGFYNLIGYNQDSLSNENNDFRLKIVAGIHDVNIQTKNIARKTNESQEEQN